MSAAICTSRSNRDGGFMGLEASSSQLDAQEVRKRRREAYLVLPLGILFLVFTWIQYKLFDISQALPFVHAVFFFGLVNFNIILFLLLFFLIFRNIVKVFAERQGGVIGSSLKAKLIAAFVVFSFVPTVLMFLVSVFYINNSFDKWFSEKMAGVLKNSLEVTNAYYLNAKKKNYHFASRIASDLQRTRHPTKKILQELQTKYSVDAVEFYPGLFGAREIAIAPEEGLPDLPKVSLEFLKKGIEAQSEASTIHHFGEGNLVRVIVPFSNDGAIVVSSFVPLSLISRMNDITSAYEDFRDVNPLEYPLKSIYLIILVLMSLVIFLGATWFGIYLARQLSIPLEELGEATARVAKGDFRVVNTISGSKEINRLIHSFNTMTTTLQQTLSRLDEHTRYVEVVLSNVTTGVISVDHRGVITMINRRASQLLEIEAEGYLGKRSKDIASLPVSDVFRELKPDLEHRTINNLQKEIRIQVRDREIPLQTTLSILHDDAGRVLGKVLVFDDLSPVLNAQRAAAWTEVARRIAHEIKNPLTPIRLAAQRIQRKFGAQISDPAFSECVEMIINQVDDIKVLVNEFSNFARMPQVQPRRGDFNRTVEDALKVFRESNLNLRFVFTPDVLLPLFNFDPEQMGRVVKNLIDNSIAALKNVVGGQIEIRTQFELQLRLVRLTISDNGIGIPKGIRDRIFEPYVTSKSQGTGLGLAIVKRTVEDHNGFIRALPNSPQGTKIIVELPVQDITTTLFAGEETV